MKAACSVMAKTMSKGISLGLSLLFFLRCWGPCWGQACTCWVSGKHIATKIQHLHHPQSHTNPSSRSLPKFPIGRCCCRSRSSFLRGRVGPEEECLFGVHMSNLCRKQDMEAQRQGTFSANQCRLSVPPIPPALGGV